MFRRGFLQGLIGAVAGLLGFGKASAGTNWPHGETEPNYEAWAPLLKQPTLPPQPLNDSSREVYVLRPQPGDVVVVKCRTHGIGQNEMNQVVSAIHRAAPDVPVIFVDGVVDVATEKAADVEEIEVVTGEWQRGLFGPNTVSVVKTGTKKILLRKP